MIRPITFLMFLLACGSGMYLYHAKHGVHVLDQQIERTVRQTETLREQTRALHAEWMLLNDPDRLRRLSLQYLGTLQPVAPTQFTDLADLDSHLPAPVAPTPAPPPPAAALIASGSDPAATGDQADAAQSAVAAADQAQAADTDQTADALPIPPAAPVEPPPAPRPVIAQAPAHPAPHIVEASVARPHPVATPERSAEHAAVWKPAVPHPVMADTAPRFVRPEPRPTPTVRPQPVAAPAFGGSMLGMAHGLPSVPPPRPVPLDAAYSTSNTGG